MKVFVSGATGVLGRRAVAQLVEAGAEVTGLARTREKALVLQALGATPVEVSLFDPDRLRTTIGGHDAVCNLATAIPTGEGAASRAAWAENHAIRTEGAQNLVDAAIHAGVDRYVQESIGLLYADGGDEYLDESAPVDPTWVTESALSAEAHAVRFSDHGGAGVALRFGVFYGPDSAHTIEAMHAAAQGLFTVPGPADAFWSSVTTDDAAAAVVLALGAPSGTYNVADDRPLRRSELAAALANATGVDALGPPAEGADLPPDLSAMGRSLRISSQLFRSLTGWQPRSPSAWEGWQMVVDALQKRPVA